MFFTKLGSKGSPTSVAVPVSRVALASGRNRIGSSISHRAGVDAGRGITAAREKQEGHDQRRAEVASKKIPNHAGS
jgi:hypothetical protein